MQPPVRVRRVLAVAASLAILTFSGWASADPPSRVARLAYATDAVSFSPAGENDWVQGTMNRPLTTGDRLWSGDGARAEIQVGSAAIRMDAHTSVAILSLDDQITQLQLTQGTLAVRVRRLVDGETFEVATPNLAFTLRQPGDYRITVEPDGDATTIILRKGQGEAYGDGAAYVIDTRQPYRFTGTGLREYRAVDAPRLDEFDRWASERDRRFDRSVSARYVSPDVIGYQDLDANGTWRVDASYGNVWIPSRVPANWAPYRDGHWAWVDPWGWTWVDDAPWGFAVSHYGRWAHVQGVWGWVPGPARERAYYAPALVAFVGGSNFQLSVSGGNVAGVAWFPLAPREVYRPSYPVSRGYFENVNRSNTVINTTVINHYYGNTNVANVVYANRRVPGAIVAVPANAFVQSQSISRAAVRVSRETIESRPVAAAATVAPTQRSVHGAAVRGEKPPARAHERPVIARTAPPAAHAGFAEQQQHLKEQPGQPLDAATRRNLRPEKTLPAPAVKIVTQPREARPTLRPPAHTPGETPAGARTKPVEREAAKAQAGTAPVAPAPAKPDLPPHRGAPEKAENGLRPTQAMPPAATTQAPAPRSQPEPGARAQPAAAGPVPAQRATEPQAVPAQAQQPATAARAAREAGQDEPRSRPDTGPGARPSPSRQPAPASEAASRPTTPRGRAPRPDTGKPEDAKKDRNQPGQRDPENRRP